MTKINELPAATEITADDLLEIENDPSGTPQSQKLTGALLAAFALGYIASLTEATSMDESTDFLGAIVGGALRKVAPAAVLQSLRNLTGAGANIASNDRFVFTDESAAGDPAKQATFDDILCSIKNLGEATTVPAAHRMLIVDTSTPTAYWLTLMTLLKGIDDFTNLTTPATGDKILILDADSSATPKAIGAGVLFGELLTVLSAFSGAVDGAADLLYYRDAGTGILHSITPNKLAAGVYTMGIPAAALRPRQSSGPAALATTSGSSGQPDIPYLAFDGAAAEYAILGPIWLPKGWDAGTLKARFAWRRASGTGAANVVWAMRALSIGDNETPAQNFGTAATVTAAASTTTANFKFSDFTGDCTIAGSPGKGDLIFLEFYRDGAAGGDTLNSVDAWLSAIELLYTTDARDDA